MRWRWLIGDYADPEFMLTRKERSEIARLAQAEVVRTRSIFVFSFVCVLPPAFLALWLLPHLLGFLHLAGQNVPYMIGLAVIVLLFWPWSAWAYARVYGKPCRLAMLKLGRLVCVDCGYRLEGLGPEITRCPECGSPRLPIEPPTTPT